MMESFYGGPPGQSFVIKRIFTSKNGVTDSLKADLALGWHSLILPGDFVVVSYGLPSDPEHYDQYKKIDEDAEQKSYNSTLWRKAYNEDAKVNAEYSITNANGLRYDLQSSMTGVVPEFSVAIEDSLDADQPPKVEIVNPENPDSPQLKFTVPKNQLVGIGTVTPTGANGKVDVQMNNADINHPKINFWLPQTQKFSKVQVVWVDAGTADVPKVEVVTSGEEATELEPVLKFTFPKTPVFLAENITSQVLNANQKPAVVPDLSDPNNPKIKFQLPQAQVMGKPTTEVIGPGEEPSVSINNSDINAPFLEFNLPRAVHFFYGDLLGQQSQTTTTDPSFTEYEIGDYYVNIPSGNIYEVTAKSNTTTATFDFKACLQAPKPTINTTPISPYTGPQGDPVDPSVERTLDEAAHSWSLDFSLPRAPKIAVNKDIIAAPADEATAEVEVTDADTVTFDFKVPRGSRIFNAEGIPSPGEPQEAKEGDYFLDLHTGDVYLYDGADWQKQDGGIRGPVGEALHMAASYTLTVGSDYDKNTLENGTDYIEAHYEAGDPKQEENIFSITWVDGEEQITYWQFYTHEKVWDRVRISALNSSILSDTYISDANKGYTSTYVNGLINNTQSEKHRTTYSKEAIEQLLTWGTFDD